MNNTVEVTISSIWTSKTFWTQLIGIAASVAAVFGLDISMEQQVAVVTMIQAIAAGVTVLLKLFAKPTITQGQADRV